VGKHDGRRHLENPRVDGRIILKWILGKWDGEGAWNGSIWLRIESVVTNLQVP
jgi:hypothetical protein